MEDYVQSILDAGLGEVGELLPELLERLPPELRPLVSSFTYLSFVQGYGAERSLELDLAASVLWSNLDQIRVN